MKYNYSKVNSKTFNHPFYYNDSTIFTSSVFFYSLRIQSCIRLFCSWAKKLRLPIEGMSTFYQGVACTELIESQTNCTARNRRDTAEQSRSIFLDIAHHKPVSRMWASIASLCNTLPSALLLIPQTKNTAVHRAVKNAESPSTAINYILNRLLKWIKPQRKHMYLKILNIFIKFFAFLLNYTNSYVSYHRRIEKLMLEGTHKIIGPSSPLKAVSTLRFLSRCLEPCF